MKRNILLDVLIVVALVAVLAVVGIGVKMSLESKQAQRSTAGATANGGMQGNGGGGGQFAQMREKYKYTFQLMRMAGNIARLEEEGKAPLTPAQAKAVLAVLEPLRSKPSLSQDEAKDALKGLKAALNEQQLTEIGKMKQPERRRMQGGQGGPGQGPGGQRPNINPEAMKNFNPFNPPKDSPMAGRSAERWNQFFAALQKKAKG